MGSTARPPFDRWPEKVTKMHYFCQATRGDHGNRKTARTRREQTRGLVREVATEKKGLVKAVH